MSLDLLFEKKINKKKNNEKYYFLEMKCNGKLRKEILNLTKLLGFSLKNNNIISTYLNRYDSFEQIKNMFQYLCEKDNFNNDDFFENDNFKKIFKVVKTKNENIIELKIE